MDELEYIKFNDTKVIDDRIKYLENKDDLTEDEEVELDDLIQLVEDVNSLEIEACFLVSYLEKVANKLKK